MLNTVSVAFHVYTYRTIRRINIINFNDQEDVYITR